MSKGMQDMWKGGKRTAQQAMDDSLETAQGSRFSGSLFATIISAAALLFSGYSFYESVLRAPSIAVYVPPQIDYIDPDRPDSPFEVFILPVTLANDGARSGTVLSIDLEITNPRTTESKMFYAAQKGSYGTQPSMPFAPVSLSGKASFSTALQFFPRRGEKVARILDLEPGNYKFKLTLNTAAAGGDTLFGAKKQVKPLEFEMQAGKMDYRFFTNNNTMELWDDDYQPAASQ